MVQSFFGEFSMQETMVPEQLMLGCGWPGPCTVACVYTFDRYITLAHVRLRISRLFTYHKPRLLWQVLLAVDWGDESEKAFWAQVEAPPVRLISRGPAGTRGVRSGIGGEGEPGAWREVGDREHIADTILPIPAERDLHEVEMDNTSQDGARWIIRHGGESILTVTVQRVARSLLFLYVVLHPYVTIYLPGSHWRLTQS
jgi:hypothetical protein